jgi:lysophospholipase L1-like esterase
VVIDGGTPTDLPTTGAAKTYTLASGLPSGTHTLLFTKKTESYSGVIQLLAVTPTGGALVPSPEPYSRRIEFVGDSITCGYGNLGPNETCHGNADNSDETLAYGALTAARLNAQQTAIAYSGIGMYRNINGTANTMPQRYGRTLADDPNSVWGFTTPPPDVVVVNLSTNDFAPTPHDPGMPFQTAYISFLQQLRQHYPNAPILCMASPMLAGPSRTESIAYIQNAVQARNVAGDAKVSVVAAGVDAGVVGTGPDAGVDLVFVAQNGAVDGLGCDYHPSLATDKRMADALVPAIQRVTGW